MKKGRSVYLPCHDHCTTLEFYADPEGDFYTFSFLTDNLRAGGFWQRLKAAIYIILGKEMCWAEIIQLEQKPIKNFLGVCNKVLLDIEDECKL